MATIQDITTGASYRGDAALGSGFNPAVEIDTRQLDKLAQYTFFYNRDKWQQNQKDLEDKAKQLADLTTYDLTNAIPKFSKQLRDEYNELYEWARKNNTALDYKTNPEKWMEFQKKKNDILNNIKDGKSQEILFAAGKAAIEKETRPDVKAVMQEELDKEIATKDIRTPFSLQQYDADPLVLPKVPLREFDVIKRDAKGDILVDRKIETADQKFINETAASMALGFMKEQVDVNSPEFKNLPANLQALKLEESKRRKATGRNSIVDQAEVATMALKEFTDPTTGKIDIDKAKAKNPIISGIIEGIDKYNEDMAATIAQIKAGGFQDELGTVKFGMNGIDERDYALIDYTDGDITAVDLAKLQLKAKAPTTSYTTDVKELNNAFQEKQLALQWYNAKTARKNADKPDAASTPKQPDLVTQPALLFGEYVNRLKTVFDKNKDNNKNLTVSYKATDEITRKVLDLKEGQYVTYRRDGTALVGSDANGNGGTPLTIEQQKNNLILAVKGGSKEEATLDAKFLGEAETGIQGIFGTTSGTAIWDNWGSTKVPTKTPEAATKSGGMTDAEYQEFLKKNGLK